MELWDAYDELENKLDFTLVRGEKIPEGIYHLVCEVVVKHSDETYLLMQRDFNKQSWPGYWEVGASGSALKNETPIEAATRELFEETGIKVTDMKEIFHFLCKQEKSIYYGYITTVDIPKTAITFQKDETIAYKWFTKQEVLNFLESEDCIITQRKRLLSLLK